VSERRGANPPRNNSARVRIFEDGGGLRWTLESAYYGETLQGAGVGADNVPQRFTLKRAGR
jgi:hypothetical protein